MQLLLLFLKWCNPLAARWWHGSHGEHVTCIKMLVVHFISIYRLASLWCLWCFTCPFCCLFHHSLWLGNQSRILNFQSLFFKLSFFQSLLPGLLGNCPDDIELATETSVW